MKKFFLLGGVSAMLFAASCQDAPKADQAEVADAQDVQNSEGVVVPVDLSSSKVQWVGTKPVGSHTGSIQIKEGTVVLSGDAVTGGQFVLDATSIQPVDQDEEGNTKLRNHLLSGDFFEAETYPEFVFEITNVVEGVEPSEELIMKDATHMVTGNLTMKGITKSITFPAKIESNDSKVLAHANFNIDRTEWGIVYGNDKSLGDQFIHPMINLELHVEGSK